jgi:hypothetical protein
MKSVGGFFDKFNSKITKQVRNLVFVIETIKKHTGIDVEMKDISISNGILRIKASPVQKNEIFMKKPKILKDLGSLNALRISDIQ